MTGACVAGDRNGREDDGIEGVRTEIESRDDSEIAAAAAQRPQEVGMRRIGRLDDVAGGRHKLDADQLICGQAPRAHHPPDAAAEREAADADRGGVARTDAEAVLGEGRGDVAPRGAAADAHECAVDLDGVQRPQVDREAAGDGAPRTVTAASHDHGSAFGRRPAHGIGDVVDGIHPHDHVGFAGAGVEAARRLPAIVSRGEHASGELGNQSIDSHRTDVTGGRRHGRDPCGYSQPLRLKSRYRVTLVVAISTSAMG